MPEFNIKQNNCFFCNREKCDYRDHMQELNRNLRESKTVVNLLHTINSIYKPDERVSINIHIHDDYYECAIHCKEFQ